MSGVTKQVIGADRDAPIVPSNIQQERLSNVLWLLPTVAKGRVLVVHTGLSPWLAALSGHFDASKERILDVSMTPLRDAIRDVEGPAPDLVVLDLSAVVQATNANPATMLYELASCLGKGTTVVLQCKSRRTVPHRSVFSQVARHLARVGGRLDCAYYVAPSIDVPIEFVPVDAHAVASLESHIPRGWLRSRLRDLLIRMGWHDLLFKDVILVATL